MKPRSRPSRADLVLVCALAAGCSTESAAPPDAGGEDAMGDARVDAGDAASDAPSDSPSDGAVDAPAAAFSSAYPGDLWEGEPHIAVGANGYVAAAWIASTSPGWSQPTYLGYSFSTDFGSTWTPVQIVRAPLSVRYFDGTFDHEYAMDPVVAVDANNGFYLAFLANAATGLGVDSHVYVAAASPGATTFGAPVDVTAPGTGTPSDAGPARASFDKPWMTVTKNHELVVAYTAYDPVGCAGSPPWNGCVGNLMVSRSADATSWTQQQMTANDARADGGVGYPIAGAAVFCASSTTSRLWLVYALEDESIGIHDVVLRYSDDDGATWTAARSVAIVPAGARLVPYQPSCAGDGRDVWVEYALMEATGTIAKWIRVAHSSDGGDTLGAPVDALDTSTSNAAWHSALALESNGSLDVVYYGGASEGDTGASVVYVRSADKGVWWSNAHLVKTPITLTSQRLADVGPVRWLGDYLGVATRGASLYTTFTDDSNGTHVGFAKLALH